LLPNAQINPNMGLIANPDTRHYLTKDIYTHITSIPDYTEEGKFKKVVFRHLHLKDTIHFQNYIIKLSSFDKSPEIDSVIAKQIDLSVAAHLEIIGNDTTYKAKPIYIIYKNAIYSHEDYISDIGLKFSFTQIQPDENRIEIGISEEKPDYIVMKAIVFPFINILWTGTVILVIGLLIAIRRRVLENKRTT